MVNIDISALENSLNSLKEAYELFKKNDDGKLKSALQDSCIKRFEYTYETAKKMMNKYLKYAYDKTDLPVNTLFREIYGLGLIENFASWQDYRIKRNFTSHEYDINHANKIMSIMENFISDVEIFLKNLNKACEAQ